METPTSSYIQAGRKTQDNRHQKKEKENPLLAVLKEKVLLEKETNEPVTGLLYFILEGKHKPKDLELIYKSQGQRLILDFGK